MMFHFIALSHSTTNKILVPRSSHHLYHVFSSLHHHTASTHQSVVPKGHEALDNAGQRLGDRQHIIRDILVLGLLARVELVVLFHGRGWGRVRSPPDEYLVRAVLLDGLRLVKACSQRERERERALERKRKRNRKREREKTRALERRRERERDPGRSVPFRVQKHARALASKHAHACSSGRGHAAMSRRD
jgi:hypothetical protein